MRIHRMVLLVLPLSLLLGACENDDALDADDVAELEQLMESYRQAVLTGNAPAIADLYAEDGVELPPNAPIVEGREAIRANYLAQNAVMSDFQVTPVVTEGNDELAWQRGTFVASLMLPGMTESQTEEGKYLWVAERGEDGAWRFVTVMWNSSEAMPIG